MRRGSMRSPRGTRLVSCDVCCSRSLALLGARFCAALGPAATLLALPRSLESAALARALARRRFFVRLFRFLSRPFSLFIRSRPALRFARRTPITACGRLRGIVGEQHEVQSPGEIFRSPSTRDCSQRISRPSSAGRRGSPGTDRSSRLDERQRLEQLVERAEAAGKMMNALEYLMNIVFRTKK
jgi:hypothetical protein